MPKLADRIKRRVAVEDHSEGEDDNISISEKALASEDEEDEDDLDENSSEEDEEDEEDEEEDNNEEDIEKSSKEENKDTEDQEQKQQQQQEYEESKHNNNITADIATTGAGATDNPRVPKATGKVRTLGHGKNRIGTWRSDMDSLQNGMAKAKISETNKDTLENESSTSPSSNNLPNILSRPHSTPPNRPNTRTPSKSSFQRQMEERREYQRLLKEDPSFVPYVGEFWGHDDRFRSDGLKNSSHLRGRRAFNKRGLGRAVRSNGFTESAPAVTASASDVAADFLDKPSEIHEDALDGPEVVKSNGKWQHDLFAGLVEQEKKRRKEPDRSRREREHFTNVRGRGRGGPVRSRGGYVNSRRGRHFNFTERPSSTTSTSFTTNTIDSPKIDVETPGNTTEAGSLEPTPKRKADEHTFSNNTISQSPDESLSPKNQVTIETKTSATEAKEDKLASQASTHNAEKDETSRKTGRDENNESDIEIILDSAQSQEQLLGQDAVEPSSVPISSSAGNLANKDFSKFPDANVPVFVPPRPYKNHSEQFPSRTNRPKSTGTDRRVTIRPPPDYQGPENPYVTPASNNDTSVPLYARSFQPTVQPVNASVVPPPDSQHYSPGHIYYGAQAQGTTIMPATFEANGMMYYGYDPSQMYYYYPPVSVAPMINGAGAPMMPMFVPVANGDMNGYSYPIQQNDVAGENSELTNNPHRFSAPPYYYPVYQ